MKRIDEIISLRKKEEYITEECQNRANELRGLYADGGHLYSGFISLLDCTTKESFSVNDREDYPTLLEVSVAFGKDWAIKIIMKTLERIQLTRKLKSDGDRDSDVFKFIGNFIFDGHKSLNLIDMVNFFIMATDDKLGKFEFSLKKQDVMSAIRQYERYRNEVINNLRVQSSADMMRNLSDDYMRRWSIIPQIEPGILSLTAYRNILLLHKRGESDKEMLDYLHVDSETLDNIIMAHEISGSDHDDPLGGEFVTLPKVLLYDIISKTRT